MAYWCSARILSRDARKAQTRRPSSKRSSTRSRRTKQNAGRLAMSREGRGRLGCAVGHSTPAVALVVNKNVGFSLPVADASTTRLPLVPSGPRGATRAPLGAGRGRSFLIWRDRSHYQSSQLPHLSTCSEPCL